MFGLLASGGLVTWVLITDGVRDIAFALSGNLMPLYLESIGGMTYQQIGWLGSAFGICMMATNVPAGWLADKKGERIGIGAWFSCWRPWRWVCSWSHRAFGAIPALTWALFGVGVG